MPRRPNVIMIIYYHIPIRLFRVLILLFAFSKNLSAQKDSSSNVRFSNSVYLEHGGNAVTSINWCFNNSGCHQWMNFSINYERLLSKKRVLILGRVGSSIPFKNEDHLVAVMINLLIGKRPLKFELGAGPEFIAINSDYSEVYTVFTSTLGVRYFSFNRRLMLKAGLTPTFGIVGSIYSGSKFGLSIGFNF